MKKVFLVAALVTALCLSASGEEYWNLRTGIQGIVAKPEDPNGAGAGFGARVLFGANGGSYDIGFEVERWSRSYDLADSLMDSLQAVGEIPAGKSVALNEQSGLGFSVMFRYRLYNLASNNVYTGAGTGFHFIQARREEARQNERTGYWAVYKIDHYLDTKQHAFVLLGVERYLAYDLNLFLEGKFTYIFDWERWDDPWLYTGTLGLRYSF